MSIAIKDPPPSATDPNLADASRTENLDAGSDGCVLDARKFRQRGPAEEILIGRWRLGLFAFYTAIALMLVGGFAVVADRPGTIISASAPTNPTIASSDPERHRN